MVDTTIHYAILHRIATQLNTDLIDDIADEDTTQAGTVVEGPLLDNPDYEEARISIELYENDPFNFDDWTWIDEPVEDEIEIGGGMTWRRRFYLFSRLLLVRTREQRADALKIASVIKARIEKSLMGTDFGDILIDGEHVSGRIFNKNIHSKTLQNGGPESWDFEIHIRFEVKTTKVYSM
jgi:hypothetical protein